MYFFRIFCFINYSLVWPILSTALVFSIIINNYSLLYQVFSYQHLFCTSNVSKNIERYIFFRCKMTDFAVVWNFAKNGKGRHFTIKTFQNLKFWDITEYRIEEVRIFALKKWSILMKYLKNVKLKLRKCINDPFIAKQKLNLSLPGSL